MAIGITVERWAAPLPPVSLRRFCDCGPSASCWSGRVATALSVKALPDSTPITTATNTTGVAIAGLGAGALMIAITPDGTRAYAVSYTHLRAHETRHDIVCRL